MPQAPLSTEDMIAAVDAVARSGSVTEAAREIGINRLTLTHRLRRAKQMGIRPESPASFTVDPLPSPDETIEQLLARKRAIAQRALDADAARTAILVKLAMGGPIGLFMMGDPHLDNDGCDWPALERDIALVSRNPRILSLNIGDVVDGWVGRLERLYAASSVKATDGWRLAEWLFTQPVNWLALVGGNHDAWSGHRDPLKWITRGRVPLYEPNAARLTLQHPCGIETRVHARHTFRGQSMYSDLHGLRRETREGWRDHLLVAGHLHSGEDGAQVNGDGFITQMVRLSGYKRVDSYAKEQGFKSKPMHSSALAIIDPGKAEGSRARVWLAPDIETGVDYLNFIAKRAA